MQNDAISRSALERIVQQSGQDAGLHFEDMQKFLRWLKKAPALDVEPVVHARWIYSGELDEDGNCEANCSHCGAWDKHRADLKDAVPFCWKCGARMDGEAE